MTTVASTYASKNLTPLPEYVVFDPAKDKDVPKIYRTIAKPLSFPLSAADEKDVSLLTAKFDGETNCAGLAAPQIGISKAIIIFSVPDNDPELKKRRPDLTDTIPKTIWINPKYEGIESFGYNEDYEACFSIKSYAGSVTRYKKISYETYTLMGQLVKGTTEGFLARLIQHEIDHLNGILWIDKVDPNKLISLDEYRRMRQPQLEQAKTEI
ncbi:Peptide deformylase 2 [Gammaproteobacteria bacterium]